MPLRNASFKDQQAPCGQIVDGESYRDRDEEVLVTDRGRLIARLAPVMGGEQEESRRDLLVRSGRLRPPTQPLARDFFKRGLPADPTGRSLSALLDDRGEGW